MDTTENRPYIGVMRIRTEQFGYRADPQHREDLKRLAALKGVSQADVLHDLVEREIRTAEANGVLTNAPHSAKSLSRQR